MVQHRANFKKKKWAMRTKREGGKRVLAKTCLPAGRVSKRKKGNKKIKGVKLYATFSESLTNNNLEGNSKKKTTAFSFHRNVSWVEKNMR